ncbi:MerR family transcriptional regulator [Pseudomonas sp. BBP2017]|uniref:MerR family transcriptional regulator n=1 Tax=Pseudomonas sp. BBP2017 TaxID=2109731 RepID=UPI000D137B7E|nr:MerR family transcriptional regulator [Pseudomonas sp. BBP2017]PSS58757.1 helix-turn-helix-type transcriptional regulator [Pseudomonas sp. BBP2017]
MNTLDPTTSPIDCDMHTVEGLLPIREVARQTGVNPVTLRAWERRYGLIKPQRTPKGHRLYCDKDIVQIREVLSWLERGVAVSQVKRLLEDAQKSAEPANSQWGVQQLQWLGYIEQLSERPLDEDFNRTLALYPAETLCRHLLMPLLLQLKLRWSGHAKARVEQVFFLSWLRTKLAARIYHDNRELGDAPLLLLNLSESGMEPGLWLCAWLASSSGCPVRVLEWAIPAGDLALATRHINPRAVLLHSNQSIEPRHLQCLLAAGGSPFLLCGHVVSIHQESLAELPNLHLAGDPLIALHCLQRLGLLAGR